MTKAILAAEADKIQDFIFRASRLREVSGGSAILTRFCEQMPALLGCTDADVVISDGGAFRLIFASQEQAAQAGAILADLYYAATGCSLSVAAPVAWSGAEQDFPQANEQASHQLRAAKRAQAATASAHLPQIAFCTSTGVELAYRYTGAKPNLPATYLSRYSLHKGQERASRTHKEQFIEKFLADVVGAADAGQFDCPEDAHEVGRFDARDYVAYLVADGNGMGALFSRCQNRRELTLLSQRLGEIVNQSLAEPARRLYTLLAHAETIAMDSSDAQRTIPVLPMILGGDDLFVLLPAPWAIAFTAEFCRAFEQKMNAFLQAELCWTLQEQERPTMSAALVLCKSKYPFYLAHQRGEELLKAAKRLAKGSGQRQSTISIDLIVGNHLVEPDGQQGAYHASLNPYYVNASALHTNQAQGIPITRLLDARTALDGLEQKRLVQLRTLFDSKELNQLDSQKRESLEKWLARLHNLVERIGLIKGDGLLDQQQRRAALQRLGFKFQIKREKDKNQQMVERVLMPSVAQILYHLFVCLGDDQQAAYFRSVKRGRDLYASAFPDLLDWWNYLNALPPTPTAANTNDATPPNPSEVTQ